MNEDLARYILGPADDALVLGHRLSEWCAHAPTLEEDLALANIALDHLGHAQMLLAFAAESFGGKSSADSLAYFRDASEFRNFTLLERPLKFDFAATIATLYLFGSFQVMFLAALQRANEPRLSAFADKAIKEIQYHLRHARSWLSRLAHGTTESLERIQLALRERLLYTSEFFAENDKKKQLLAQFSLPNTFALKSEWSKMIADELRALGLNLDLTQQPQTSPQKNGRNGEHTEHLAAMLAEMQSLARSHPGAQW